MRKAGFDIANISSIKPYAQELPTSLGAMVLQTFLFLPVANKIWTEFDYSSGKSQFEMQKCEW